MLINLKPIGDDLQSLFKEISDWPELKFTLEIKKSLEEISFIKKVNDTSVCANTSKDGSFHTIFVSQYVLYALLAKEFATNFYKYIEVLRSLKDQGLVNSDIHSLIASKDMNSQYLKNLDALEKKFFYEVFNVEDLWGAKKILSTNNNNTPPANMMIPIIIGFSIIASILSLNNFPNINAGIVAKPIFAKNIGFFTSKNLRQ
jgi:hypothetical protein